MGGFSLDQLFGGGSQDDQEGLGLDDLFGADQPKLRIGMPAQRPPWTKDEFGNLVLERPEDRDPLAEHPLYAEGTEGRAAGRRLAVAEKPLEYLSEHRIPGLKAVAEAVGPVLASGIRAAGPVPVLTPGLPDDPLAATLTALVPQTPLDVALTAGPLVGSRLAGSAASAARRADATVRAARAASNQAALEAGLREAQRAARVAETARTIGQSAEAANVGIAAPMALEGAGGVAEGLTEGDPQALGRGLLQAGMGAAGVAMGGRGMRALEAPVRPVPTAEAVMAARRRQALLEGLPERQAQESARQAREGAEIVAEAIEDAARAPRGTAEERMALAARGPVRGLALEELPFEDLGPAGTRAVRTPQEVSVEGRAARMPQEPTPGPLVAPEPSGGATAQELAALRSEAGVPAAAVDEQAARASLQDIGEEFRRARRARELAAEAAAEPSVWDQLDEADRGRLSETPRPNVRASDALASSRENVNRRFRTVEDARAEAARLRQVTQRQDLERAAARKAELEADEARAAESVRESQTVEASLTTPEAQVLKQKRAAELLAGIQADSAAYTGSKSRKLQIRPKKMYKLEGVVPDGVGEAAASGPQVTEGNLPGGMFTAAEEARRAGRVAPPQEQRRLFGGEAASPEMAAALEEAAAAVPDAPARPARSLTINDSLASGSGGSAEALSRTAAMRARGKRYVIRDKGGAFRPTTEDGALSLRPGESFGELDNEGIYTMLDQAATPRRRGETGALRVDTRARVTIKATGEVGVVSKFHEDGTLTVDTRAGKVQVEPEAVEFMAPEELGAPRAPAGPAQPAAPAVPTQPSEKLIAMFEEGKVAIKKQKRLRHTENVTRSRDIANIFAKNPGEAGTFEAMRHLREQGQMPRADLLRQHGFSDTDVDGLFRQINEAGLMGFDELSAREGLLKLLDPSAPVPQHSEIKLLQNVFGHKFVDTLQGSPAWKRTLMDVLNLPRALAASFDMSAPLRQGLILTVAHPKRAAKAFGHMHRYFFSEKYFEQFMDGLRSNPTYPLARESGLHLATLGKGAKKSLAHGEEIFRSGLAERLPLIGRGVKASERAYMGYLDKLRMDVFSDVAQKLERTGIDTVKDAGAYKSLADWINIASGRGSAGKLDRVMDWMGQAFFSPRFMAARLQTLSPTTYVGLHPSVRKQALQELFTTGAVGASVLGLAYAAGADVELDPRATDFGKIRTGHVRTDISGGFQPYVRLAAQLSGGPEMVYQRRKGGGLEAKGRAWTRGARKTLSGEIKPLSGEGPFPETRLTLLSRMLRSKLSPPAGIVWDFLDGQQDMVGEPTTWGSNVAKAVERGAGAQEIADEITKTQQWKLFVPMFAQDVAEAAQQEGLTGAGIALTSFYGEGVNTYRTPEEAWAKTKRKAHLLGVDPAELRSSIGTGRIGR